jgi:iron complex outermembrane receptor protein
LCGYVKKINFHIFKNENYLYIASSCFQGHKPNRIVFSGGAMQSQSKGFKAQPNRLTAALLQALGASLALGITLPVMAQSTEPSQTLGKVEVTGSSIKRIEGETALPVQVITREDINKAGVTTAAELLKTISANTAPLSDGASITDGTSGQRGFNGANLRGIGVSSTLILLNGRRMANFASPGDESGVDLNNIPAGAIQRVEVLKDGASAIYGTDAIGGVINFITRRDYQGVDVGVYAAGTQEGGAGKRTATISGGFGDLGKDRFNVMGVLDIQQLDSLRSSQRDFIKERPLATTLPALMSSRTFPANIRLTTGQRNTLRNAGVTAGGQLITNRTINFSAPGCNPPASVYAPDGPGSANGCSYDYMQDTEIYPESKKLGFLGRAAYQLTDEHQVFGELILSQTKSRYVLSANPIAVTGFGPASVYYPAQLAANNIGNVEVRLRMSEAGNRTNEVTSDASRLVVGASGTFAGWDYDTAVSRAENKAVDAYVDGYVLFDQFVAGVRNGTVNPFGPSTQAGRDLINSIKINDEARKSKGVTTAFDIKGSRPLTALGGGDLALALGADLRRETTSFTPSALLTSNNIAGDRDGSGLSTDLAATSDSRRISSVFTELSAPFTKEIEAQFAVRYDNYSGVGNTTNPKAGIRWQPSKELLVRGSVGTGFRAPSLADLKRPTTFGTTSSVLTDPQCVATGDTLDNCTDQWNVERRSNPNLKPEKSKQFSLGAVFEPRTGLNFSIDYWNIQKKNVISTLGEQVIVENPDKYNGRYIERDVDGFITNIILQKENQGRLKTSGIDLGVELRGQKGDYGRFGLGVSGTYILKYDRQFGPQEPFRSNLGVFLNDQVIQRWRHRISVDWDYGAFGLTLANQYSSGYTDQNTTYDPVTDTRLPSRKVKSYSLWDLSGSWNATKDLKLRAGIQNLLDTPPPFSNQAYYFLATYDPTYTDPRGRTFYMSASYSFK